MTKNNSVPDNAYNELAAIWDKYPALKAEYIKQSEDKYGCDENMDDFIFNRHSEIWDEMEAVYIKYYGEKYDISNDETSDWYYKYFGFYWVQDIYDEQD